MNVIILGGTRFLGRAVKDACLARGDRVTLFHRGLSSEPVEHVENVIGDRDQDLSAIAHRKWDLLVDTSGYEVSAVRRSARLDVARYVFVSSISVYADPANMAEGAPVQTTEDAEHARLELENYGALKAACEAALAQTHADRLLVARAGLIVGPHDNDDRFAWWLRRIARGGVAGAAAGGTARNNEVLAPGDPDAPVQIIDARDLTRWMLDSRAVGTMNAVGDPMPMRELFDAMRAATGRRIRRRRGDANTQSDARFTWVPDEILVRHQVAPYSEMPFWLPGARPAPNARAKAEGLASRPLFDTVRDTWEWLNSGWASESAAREHKRFRVAAGISEERERRILEEHHGK